MHTIPVRPPVPDDADSGQHTLTRSQMEVGLQVARVGLGTVDYHSDTVRLDMLAAGLFDLPAGCEIPRTQLHGRIHHEDWSLIADEVDALLDPEGSDVLDMTHRILRPDGSVAWVNARKRVRYEGDRRGARPLDGVFAVVEITAQREAEIRSEMLIGELSHRAKNLIAVIGGIARQLRRHSTPDEFPERLLNRLSALARNQDVLVGDRSGTFGMREVVSQQLAPFEGRHRGRVDLDGRDLTLSPGTAQVMAMVVHELLTNAVKYGALSVEAGHVAIAWQATGDTFRLDWTESGGPEVAPPPKTGFGTQVLTTLAEASFGAEVTLDYLPSGLRAHVSAPAGRVLA